MFYKTFLGNKVSQMGMGLMRLPVIDDDNNKIDVKAAKEMVDYAYANGINYFDTAWGYHGGNSQKFIGEALKEYPRESFYLTNKFPGYDLDNMPYAEEIFEKQLEYCQVDYFDYYLIHNVCEMNMEAYLDPKFGIKEYYKKQVENGRIKHLGFSLHGKIDVFNQFMEGYGDIMEFCQLQLNYLDWEFQEVNKTYEKCKELGIEVVAMEIVRGGSLCTLDDKYMEQLSKFRKDETAVTWAYRFLQSLDNVKVNLSGVSSLEQLKENIKAFSEGEAANQEEFDALVGIAKDMFEPGRVKCTKCKYCIPKCPMGLDIPFLLDLYNEHKFSVGGFIAPMALESLDENKQPKDCIACGACRQVCPQGLKIPEYLEDFDHILEIYDQE
ncbi:MAG: aldo/keto reductase [Clostridia bacterium]|nr:aldo/keto reductase [Clostridia bacterium]